MLDIRILSFNPLMSFLFELYFSFVSSFSFRCRYVQLKNKIFKRELFVKMFTLNANLSREYHSRLSVSVGQV